MLANFLIDNYICPVIFMMRVVLFALVTLISTSLFAAPSIIPKPPAIAAKSYILIDASSGEVLVEKNADQQLPPASLTKLMSSYIVNNELAYQNIREDERVRVSVKAWKTGGSKMFIREGTYVQVIDLLKGLIIQSGNDATIALAEHISGTEEAFVDVMNQYAEQIGMANTLYKNSTGLPADGHVSTARDLSKLAQQMINDHPERYSLYSEKEFTYNNIKQSNRNLLLFWDPKVDGLKTGHTEEAGYCLVSSAVQNDMRLIAVVMGAKSERARARESQKLLTYGFRYFETHRLFEDGQQMQTSDVWLGQKNTFELGVQDGVYITIPRGQKGNLDVQYSIDEIIKAPVKKGLEYGRIKVELEGRTLVDKPMVAMEDVEEAGLLARLWDHIRLFFFSLFT
jgi:D-alanyl-D-alanine carboxypeptidase (penicillin-binding protein 5/6)